MAVIRRLSLKKKSGRSGKSIKDVYMPMALEDVPPAHGL